MTATRNARGTRAGAGKDGQDEEAPEQISVWEWVTGTVGLVLVIGALGVMLHDARRPDTPPRLGTAVDSVQRVPAGFIAHVSVTNDGTEAAASVIVEGTIEGADPATRSEATVDHLPAGATRSIGLMFQQHPGGALQVRVLGYAEP